MKKSRILLYVTSILSFVGTLILYPGLPQQIPVHFNYKWEADGYGSREMALLIGALPFLMCLLLDLLPKIDPKRRIQQKTDKSYEIMRYLLVFLMLFLNWITIFMAKGIEFNVQVVMSILMGIIFMGIGNYMPKIKPNYFLGVKTPWTLSSDLVWRKTHRISGYIFIGYGILFLMSSVITTKYIGYAMMICILAGVGFMYLYSYLVYRSEMKK